MFLERCRKALEVADGCATIFGIVWLLDNSHTNEILFFKIQRNMALESQLWGSIIASNCHSVSFLRVIGSMSSTECSFLYVLPTYLYLMGQS